MSQKKSLTRNERSVFYTLIRYPSLNDREISEQTKIKLSTVTAIRRRLQSSGFYSTVRIPNLSKLGFELLVVGYGPISVRGDGGVGSSKMLSEALGGPKEIFLSAHSSDSAFFVAAADNFTSAKRMIESIQHMLADHEVAETWSFVFFPFEISTLLNFFDCTNLMERMFKYDSSPKDIDLVFHSEDLVSLSLKEKKVLKKLVEFPDAPDNLIASKSGASRQGVSAIRKRFESLGIIQTVRIPDFQKLGYEIFILSHSLFNPKITLQEREKGIRYTTEKIPQIFLASGNFENVLLAASPNYEDFTGMKNDILRLYTQHDFIRREPQIHLMPFSEMNFVKNHDYASLLTGHWDD